MTLPLLHLHIQIPAFSSGPKVGVRRAYSQALCAEICSSAEELAEFSPVSLHISGADNLEEQGLEELLITLRKTLPMEQIKTSVSLSPEKITTANMTLFRNHHASRYDIDFGAWNVLDFHRLSRPYGRQVYLSIRSLFSCYDLHNFRASLACGLPGQTEKTLEDSLTNILSMQPEEILLNPLEESPLTEFGQKWLESRGYALQKGNAVLHPINERYAAIPLPADLPCWGFGCGAVSRMHGGLLFNTANLNTYLLHSDSLVKLIVAAVPESDADLSRETLWLFRK